MKRNWGGLFAGILLALAVAQASQAMEFSAGARLGLNVSGIIGDTSKLMMPRFGLCFGGFASEWINESFGLQEELMFDFKGESWKNQDSIDLSIFNKYPTHFTYLDVPILAKWRFINKDKIRPVLYGGPYIGFPLISESVSYGGNTYDKMSSTQPVDVGLTAGLSLDCRMGANGVIPIDIRYSIGLIDFYKRDAPNLYDRTLLQSVFSISAGLGWIFDFTKKKEF
ncbi:MAG TPA: porin family protein [Chitinivibrionales bacterium]|nr:porin family protein [Chitinivibrionales bacterium]